jgi:hypothetical protein
VNVNTTGTASSMSLKSVLADIKEFSIVVLNLKDASGKIVSRNAYWTAPENNYRALNDMPNVELSTAVIKTEKDNKENKYILQITNNTKQLAFFVRPQLMAGGDEVMPSYWSASYFTLAPGQNITVSVSTPTAKLGTQTPSMTVSGWNVKKKEIGLK